MCVCVCVFVCVCGCVRTPVKGFPVVGRCSHNWEERSGCFITLRPEDGTGPVMEAFDFGGTLQHNNSLNESNAYKDSNSSAAAEVARVLLN